MSLQSRLHSVVVLAALLTACRPAVGSYVAVPTCVVWNQSSAVVEAELVSFTPTEMYKLSDGTEYPLSRVVLDVTRVHKGSIGLGRLNAFHGHGIDVFGNSERGNMRNAKGLFWLRELDGTLGYAGPAFGREVAPGEFDQSFDGSGSRMRREDLAGFGSQCRPDAEQ